MNTKIIGLCLILIVPVAGCTLDAPCETDEIYINGSCVKCYNHPNHHLNDDGMCVPDTTEACGAGMHNCTGIGIKNSACVNGTCQIYSCMNGYELRSHDDNVLNCEPCGKSEIFYNGACVECNDYPNYHVNDAGQCVPDTNEECGAGKQRCMAEGILSGICVNGSCQINSCKEQYREVMSDGVIVGCESLEAARCGLNSVNCFEKYASVYKEGDWLEASVIGCRRDENQCAVDSCLKGFKRVTCDDYVKYFSQLFDGEMITGCDENWLESVCIPDTCSSISDIGDADHDGIFNCMDPCPNNPTKWNREKWWDNSSNTGIRCDVFDTDHDGVDDEEDECPTNPNLTKAP